MIPYEILIRGTADGKLSGSHVIDKPGSEARPITPEDLADIAPSINASALAESKAMEAKHAEALAAKDAEIATLQAKESASDSKDAEIAALTARIEELTAAPTSEVVANWRAKAVLALSGLLPMVEQAIASMEGDAGVVARYAWEGGADFARTGPTVLALAAALELTDEQLDALFAQASALAV